MTTHALDMTVLKQGASLGGDGVSSPTLAELGPLLAWLEAFRQDQTQQLAMDQGYQLWAKYVALGEENYVVRILLEKLDRQQVHACTVLYHQQDVVEVPPAFSRRNGSWKLVLALALADRTNVSVANATDLDWVRHAADLEAESVKVEHLLHGWVHEYVKRFDALGPQSGDIQYYTAPAQLEGELMSAVSVGRGTNDRKAWELNGRRYEFDSQHNTLEVYQISSRKWLHEAALDGTVTKTTGGKGRRWGRP